MIGLALILTLALRVAVAAGVEVVVQVEADATVIALEVTIANEVGVGETGVIVAHHILDRAVLHVDGHCHSHEKGATLHGPYHQDDHFPREKTVKTVVSTAILL